MDIFYRFILPSTPSPVSEGVVAIDPKLEITGCWRRVSLPTHRPGRAWRPRNAGRTGTPCRLVCGAPRWCGDSSSTWRRTTRCSNTEESRTTPDVLPRHTGPRGLRKLGAAATRLSPSWRRTRGRRARVHTSRPPCRVVRTAPAESLHNSSRGRLPGSQWLR